MLICTELGLLIPWNSKGILERLKLWKTVLGSKPGEVVFCTFKLSKIEQRRQDRSYLFGRGDYRNNEHNFEELSWVRVPVKMFPGAP
jgi:hypothetical protein